MMPTPSHLKDVVAPKDDSLDEEPLVANVVCPCDSREFTILVTSQTNQVEGGDPFPVVTQTPDGFFLVVRARCSKCNREHLLLDKDLHGWNGFVCRDTEQAAKPRPPLIAWRCCKCGGTTHRAEVTVQTEGRADFVAETDGEFDEDLWPDAFGWFAMDIECAGCGHRTARWIDYETM